MDVTYCKVEDGTETWPFATTAGQREEHKLKEALEVEKYLLIALCHRCNYVKSECSWALESESL